jgi:hypothetical protein
MKKKMVIVLSMLFVLCMVIQADADMYDFSSMGFTDGQNLEGMTLDEATFTSETGDLRYYSGYGGGIGTGYSWGAAADTYIQFSVPVFGLSFTGGDGSGDSDAFAVSLYEYGTDNFIGTWSTPVFGGANEPEWYKLDITASNVGRLVFDPGNGGVLPGVKESQGGLVITDLEFTPVPVPGAVLLGLFGLSAAGLKLRRFS